MNRAILISLLIVIFISIIAVAKVEPNIRFSLKSIDDATYSSKSLRGKAVFITFFSRVCKPCKEEVPFLNELQKKFPGSLAIVAVAFQENDIGKIRSLANEWSIKYPVCSDPDGGVARDFGADELPRGYLIGYTGKLISHYVGMSDNNRKDLLDKLSSMTKEIKAYQSTGPAFFIKELKEVNEEAKGQGKTWQQTMTSWLKENKIRMVAKESEADYIITGSVYKAPKSTGVEVMVTHFSGEKENELSDSIRTDDSRFKELFIKMLKAIPFVAKTNP